MERNENGLPGVGTNSPRQEGPLDGFFAKARRDASGSCRGTDGTKENGVDSLPLAYAYVPWQRWQMLYTPSDALKSGTLFEELNKPLGVYGNE